MRRSFRDQARNGLNSGRWMRTHRVGRIESLEARHLLAGLTISEFLASNSAGLADEDGDFSDWIELQNTTNATISLEGYGLTDRVGGPDLWRFPDVDLAPGEFLVVFASGKDRTDDAGPLHTNFRLGDEGEYLGLIAPDGQTVLQQFDPGYPGQRNGVSYGIPQSSTTSALVTGASSAFAFVPSNGSLEATWMQREFVPAGWQAGVAAIGYDQASNYDALLGSDLESSLYDRNGGAYLRAPFQIDDASLYDFLNLDMQYDDGFVAYLNGVEVARRNAPASPQWNSTATADHSGVFDTLSYADFSAGGMKRLGSTQVADGRLRLTSTAAEQRGTAWHPTPVQFGASYSFSTEFAFEVSSPGGPSESDGPGGEGFTFTIQSTGQQVLGTNSTAFGLLGGANAAQKFVAVEFDSRAGGMWDSTRATGSHVAIDAQTSQLSLGQPANVLRFNSGGVRYAWIDYDGTTQRMSVYVSQTNVKPAIATLVTPVDLGALFGGERSLNIGFTAANSNATNVHDILNWSFASGDAELGLTVEKINLTEYVDLLRDGENVLAIHGLNVAANDGDFLMLPKLTATDLDVPAGRYQFFSLPSPGRSNGNGFDGLTSEPEFSLDAGVYQSSVTVELATSTPGATIYYTTNNTAPTAGSTLYTGAITTDASTIIRAIAVRDDYIASEVAVSRYTVLAEDVRSFSSNLPLMVLDTYTKSPNESVLTEVAATVIDVDQSGRASLNGEIDFHGRGAFKLRGSSSLGFPKQQFAFEVWDEAGGDDAVSLLGMPEESDWIIYAPYSEKALMQNALAYDWSRKMGQYAPRVKFVELYVNTTGAVAASDYRGIYILMEKIKRDVARVNITEMGPEDNEGSEVTGGYILKKDRLDPGDTGFSTSRGQVLGFVEPKEDEITPAQRAYITGYMNAFESSLYGDNFADPVDGYAKYIDVDSFIDHHIMVEVTKNIDGYRLSTFMYKDRDGKLVMGPIWDYNLSMGNANYLQGEFPAGWYYPQLGTGDYPWYGRLFQDPEFQQRYVDRWTELRQTVFATEKLMADVDAYATLLDEAQVRNFQRWPILGIYVWPNPTGYAERNTFQKEVDFLKSFMSTRLSWIDSNWPFVPAFSHPGGQVPEGFRVDLLSAGHQIYYTTDGSDPRLPGGAVHPNAVRVEPGVGATLLPLGAPAKVFVPTDNTLGTRWREQVFDDSTWTDATTGIGFDTDGSLADHIETDISAQMLGKNASVYIRLPFEVQDPSALIALRMRLKYDDGVIAHLNGKEIFFRNATIRGRTWNGAAAADRTDEQATAAEEIDLTPFIYLLKPGVNVFAFQAMNQAVANGDFLFAPEIVEITGTAATLELNESTFIRARAYNGSAWSGLGEASFLVGDGLPLRVTELMYNPASPAAGPFVAADFEYIELQNVGASSIPLKGAQFTLGVTMELPDVLLAAGARGVVVANRAAFESRYGLGLPILGEFEGQLSNAGEQVTLTGALGDTILDFSYDDGWYPSTDGQGYSLVIIDPSAAKDSWSQKSAWRASFAPGGTPGSDDRLPGDANQDGKVDIEDLNIVRSSFGESGPGDVNGDGIVDLQDLNAVRNALASVPPAPIAAPTRVAPAVVRRSELSEAARLTSFVAKRRAVDVNAWDDALLELLKPTK